ncbi:hypothetical protein [Rhodococcus jostii]|uniref:PucR family transcriptional regulator n=1 Tax=Rhodococcus jostii TaxID=132919 RepID=UPI00115FFF5C|nr:hypothetical protein [Rhodococcus jostii]
MAPAQQLSDISAAVGQAREIVQISRRFDTRKNRVILSRDVGVQRLLAADLAPAALTAFIAEQLGFVIAYDTTHSADLGRTLDAYLATRGSKARTATVLGFDVSPAMPG